MAKRSRSSSSSEDTSIDISALEKEVASLKKEVAELKQALADFKKEKSSGGEDPRVDKIIEVIHKMGKGKLLK